MRNMRRIKFFIIFLAIFAAVAAIVFVLTRENALVTHPKGMIARSELDLIHTNIFLMLIVIVPTFLFLFYTVWRYRVKNAKAKYDPEHSHGVWGTVILWVVPSIVIAVMSVITWRAAHELDPYRPIESEAPPLTIQVVALDWKWLFIYPEQGIATVNFVQYPERTPIHFELAADGTPMNSFWLPQMSGQIYAMTGMVTQLHIMADGPGVYTGRAAEINGKGYADMTFIAKSTSLADFDAWVADVRESPLHLTLPVYDELAKDSQNHPITLYSHVRDDLFMHIVMKYMQVP